MSRWQPTRTPGTLADSREELLLGEPAQFAQQLRVAQTGRLSAGIGFGPGLKPLPAKAPIDAEDGIMRSGTARKADRVITIHLSPNRKDRP